MADYRLDTLDGTRILMTGHSGFLGSWLAGMAARLGATVVGLEWGWLVRVLMLTAAGDVRARVAGLSLGADDYLPKPFAFEELVARVHALGRRARRADPPMLERAGVRLDWAHRQVFREGRYVPLARKEFGLLAELLRAQGAVVSAETLLEKVWDEHIDPFTNTVRTTMMKLRKKLGEPQVIETVPGPGYRIP
ncbi:hypothetical protein GCM10020216_030890 [Nonomuraea helvata]